MLYNIFLLILIIILLSIKIYKNKDEYFNDYTEINGLMDIKATITTTDSGKTCESHCNNLIGNSQPCTGYQLIRTDTVIGSIKRDVCRISTEEINSQNLIASTLNNPLHIADCSKPTEGINSCDDGGIEKARRNKLKNVCVSKTFNPGDCPTLQTLCDDLPPPCP